MSTDETTDVAAKAKNERRTTGTLRKWTPDEEALLRELVGSLATKSGRTSMASQRMHGHMLPGVFASQRLRCQAALAAYLQPNASFVVGPPLKLSVLARAGGGGYARPLLAG